jgi:hypothetical protein
MAVEISRMLKIKSEHPSPKIIITAGHKDGIFAYGPDLASAFNSLVEIMRANNFI